MTLTLPLTPELEQWLTDEAQRQGMSVPQCALQILEEHLPPQDRRAKLVALLQSWIDEDNEAEQKETGDYLIRVLDEDRLSDRPLYPPDLKGVTW